MYKLSPVANDRLQRNWTVLLAVVGLALWWLAISEASFVQMGGNGLVTILRWPYFAGLCVVCVAFVAELFRAKSSDARLVTLILALVVILYGTASVVEPVASITESWLHTGFISYIYDHGHILHGYDARFSWPGDFVLAAMLSAFVGHTNSLAFTRFFPLFIEALYLAPVMVIGAHAGVSRRTKWLGVAFFYATDWIYQDYFSPQAMDYFFYLVVIAVVLAAWSPSRRSYVRGQGLVVTKIGQVRNSLSWRRIAGAQTVSNFPLGTLFPVMALLAIIMLAMAMSHQLTPYALILALAACLLTSRLGRPELLALAVLFAVGWLSLGATDFWLGHLSLIFGGIGQVGSAIGSNVGSRVVGSASHRFIVSARIEFTAVVFLIAGVGVLRRATMSRALEFLVAAPFAIIFLQGYGGEGLLRVVLFGLPFTSLLAASALLPTRSGEVRPWISHVRWLKPMVGVRYATVGVLLIAMCVVTTIVRGGNDAYESYSLGELDAVTYVYNHIAPGQTIGTVVEYLPIDQRDVGTVGILSIAGSNVPLLSQVAKLLLRLRPNFIILSRSQEAWGEVVGGYPKGWETQLARKVLANDYRRVAFWHTAQVYEAFTPRKWPVSGK